MDFEVNCVILGGEKVGKTSLVSSFCTGHFFSEYMATLAPDLYKRNFIVDVSTVLVKIHDTGFQFSGHLIEKYLKESDVILMAYSCANRKSLVHDLRNLVSKYHEIMGSVKPLILVGSMADLVTDDINHDDRVSLEMAVEEAKQMSKQYNLNIETVVECSAKESKNVETVFKEVVRSFTGQSTPVADDKPLNTFYIVERKTKEEKQKSFPSLLSFASQSESHEVVQDIVLEYLNSGNS